MLDVGISSCGFLFTEENFKSLKESGIKHIEISRGWLEYPDMDFAEIKRLADKYDIKEINVVNEKGISPLQAQHNWTFLRLTRLFAKTPWTGGAPL